MKTLYIDCSMGAAGDMLTAALLEIASQSAGGSREESGESGENGGCAARAAEFVRNFNALGIPGVEMEAYKDVKHGITGTRVRIRVNGEEEHAHDDAHTHDHAHSHEHAHFHHHDRDDAHEHAHRSMKDIEAVISGLALDDAVRADVLSVYRIIAEAEGEVHGRPAGEVHFHEVGAMDAVADVTAVCMLMHEIAADEIVASPVATGYGTVRCAHGLLPVPAPATAVILRGVPAYAGDVEGELCTPTGAALIKHFAEEYSQMPLMRTEAIGYGLGTKDFEKANCLRIFLGESV